MSLNSSENSENVCVVCFKNVEIYSIGSCDHMVCYECSTRMRVLCRQNECPICRQDLPRVIFTSTIKPFSEIQNCSHLEDKKYKISFQNRKIQDAFYKLLEHSCSVCPKSPTFRNFQGLYDHMKKEHKLYYCDLCVEFLKIFTSERQSYTLKNLEKHREKGDADDRSHRGHPLCQFCDVRYMDNDHLYRHLRREHLFCHFCDADGLDLYYSSYDYLREHFRTDHYLCEEGSCVDEKFTPVFRTDIDLKAHRASAHGRTLGKVAAKQARTLELAFTLKPRPRQGEAFKRGRLPGNESSSLEGAVGGILDQTSTNRTNLPNLDTSEFPYLPSGPGSTTTFVPQQGSRSGGLTIHAVGRRNAPLAITDENFPVLGVYNDSLPGTSVRLNFNQERSAAGKSSSGPPRNVSIHVNHRANGEQNIRIRQDDFPALTSEKVQPTLAAAKWSSISSKKPPPKTTTTVSSTTTTTTTTSSSSKPSKQTLLDNDFPCLNSKFSTNLNLKANEPMKPNFVNIKSYKENKSEGQKGKNSSTVTIPVQNDWSDNAETSTSNLKGKSKKKKSKGSGSEEKTDTAKKKQSDKKTESKCENKEDNSKESPKSALNVTSSNGNAPIKPLPTAEDWFQELKKVDKKAKGEDEELDFFSADVSCNSKKFTSVAFPPVTNLTCSSSSKNNNNNNNNQEAKEETSLSNHKFDKKPPPGFSVPSGHFNGNNVKKPPPGFSADFPQSNGLTFTNSSGQSYAISADFDYTPPVDFEKRNQNLVSKVNKIVMNDTNLEQFRKMSVLFRQDMLSAEEYYEHCMKAMGKTGIQEVFPELLALLPDISKQQELFEVYSRSGNLSKESQSLKTCTTCRQVVHAKDAEQHSAHHSMQQNFPALLTDHWTK